jgi:hypothetical protein
MAHCSKEEESALPIPKKRKDDHGHLPQQQP